MADSLEDLSVRLLGDGKSYESMIQSAIGGLGKLTSSVGASASQIQGITQSMTQFGGQAQGIIGMLASGLGIGSIMGTVQTAISKAAETESIEMAFKSLIGNADEARVTLDKLRAFAVATPFELPQILEAAKSMLAYGQQAETIVPTMQRLGDVASALNIPLSSLTYLYGTLKSSGRVMTVDMRQFANRGIPIWLELAKVLGMVTQDTRELTGAQSAQLQQMVSKGKINFDMIEKAFISMTSQGGRFFNMMKDQSLTFNGIVSNIKDSLGLLLADIGKQLIEGFDMKRILAEIRETATAFADWFKNMNPQLKKTVFTILAVVAGLGVVTAAVMTLIGIFTVLSYVVGSIGLPFLIVIAAVVAAIAVWVQSVGGVGAALDIIKSKWAEFMEFIDPVVQAFRSLLPVAWETFKGAVVAGVEVIVDFWNRMLEQVMGFWNGLQQVWGWVQTSFSDMFGLTGENAAGTWAKIRDKVVETIYFIEYTLKNFQKVTDVVWQALKYGIVATFEMLKFYMVQIPTTYGPYLLTTFQKVFKAIFEAGSGAFIGIFGTVAEIAQNIPKLLKGELKVSDLFANAFGKLKEGLGDVLGEVPTMPERQLGQLEKDLLANLKQTGSALYDDFQAFLKTKQKTGEIGVPEEEVKKNTKKNEEIVQSTRKAVKEITKFDHALMGSTESFARIMDYRSKFLNTETVAGLAKAAVASSGVGAAAAASPNPAMVPATPPVEHRGGWFGDEVKTVLENIEKNTAKDPLGRPVVAGESTLQGGGDGGGDDWF
jgi:hypothetical protein